MATVASLTWEAVPGNAELETCPNNGGVRMFPDWLSPLDDPNPSDLRRHVRLVAQVEPAVAGLTVHFRVFDVDDPFDQLHGPNATDPNPSTPQNEAEIANVGILDSNNPTSGPDNRPTPEAQVPLVGTTDAQGRAQVTFTVSMQPGNNFRAAASLIEDALTQDTVYNGQSVDAQAHADALSVRMKDDKFVPNGGFSGYSCPRTWSPMLTVWRKLHIEADSMLSEPQTVPEREPDWQAVLATVVSPGQNSSNVELAWPLSGSDPHQFEGGRITFGSYTFVIIDHTSDVVEVAYVFTPPELFLVQNQNGTIKDDDPNSGLLSFQWLPSTFAKTAYKDAYVDIVNLSGEFNPRVTSPFDLYIRGDANFSPTKDVWSQNNYWVSYIRAAYQAGSLFWPLALVDGRDNDPDPLKDNVNWQNTDWWGSDYEEYAQTGWTNYNGDWESVFFRATIADITMWAHELDQVVCHEIGHSAGNTGNEAQHHAEGGLMREGILEDDTRFTAETLVRFRGAQKW